jgi:SAM-dependent methyltransferase
MSGYSAATYGDEIAEMYDQWYSSLDAEGAVQLLAELAGPGPVLELGIGTGRVALPLARRGIEVHGIEASEAMVAKLRAKPDGDGVAVIIGDFADVDVEGEFSLVCVPFNTIFCLLNQEDQLRCFQNVARRLSADGVFVVEAFVPDLSRFDRGQRVGLEDFAPDGIRIEASKHDRLNQRVETRHVVISQRGVQFYPLQIRYAYPSELDLMARLAGLRLRERWGGWRRESFTAGSVSHVSVYARSG